MVKPKPIAPKTLLYRAARLIAIRAEVIAVALTKQEYDELLTIATELRRLARRLPPAGASFWIRNQRS